MYVTVDNTVIYAMLHSPQPQECFVWVMPV